jgi:ABC-type Fe3+ transport system permease subunit
MNMIRVVTIITITSTTIPRLRRCLDSKNDTALDGPVFPQAKGWQRKQFRHACRVCAYSCIVVVVVVVIDKRHVLLQISMWQKRLAFSFLLDGRARGVVTSVFISAVGTLVIIIIIIIIILTSILVPKDKGTRSSTDAILSWCTAGKQTISKLKELKATG